MLRPTQMKDGGGGGRDREEETLAAADPAIKTKNKTNPTTKNNKLSDVGFNLSSDVGLTY